MFSRKLLIIYIILLFIALVIMGILIHNKPVKVPPRDYEEIKQEGVLRIVTEYNQSGYFMSGDTIHGFQYELSKAISELSGLKIEMFLEMNLDKSFQGLQRNYYDIIARNIPTTSDLKRDYLFVEPIVLNKQVLVQRTAIENNGVEPIRNQLDLAKKTLYVPKNSPALLRLQNLEHEIADTIHIIEDPLYSSEQLIIMVAKGDIEYAVCDQQIALLSQKQLPEIDIDTDISFTQLQSWAVRKNSPALLDSLNHWFQIMRENGEFDQIYQKYYTAVPPKAEKKRFSSSTTSNDSTMNESEGSESSSESTPSETNTEEKTQEATPASSIEEKNE